MSEAFKIQPIFIVIVLDILAGQAKRAPKIFIKLNLEWFYRLITNPSRFKRQLAIPKFLVSILLDKKSVQ